MTAPAMTSPEEKARDADHEFIWLQNAEDGKHNSDGRLWCEDKIWPDKPEDGEPTKYIRADLVDAAIQAAVDEAYEDAIKIAKEEAERRTRVRGQLLDSRLEATAQETGREAAENIRAAIVERAASRRSRTKPPATEKTG